MTNATFQLRDYQQDLIAKIFAFWQSGNKRVMAQCPTGAGKTICFTYIARKFIGQKTRVLILAHREELIVQAIGKTRDIIGIKSGVIKNGFKPNYDALIQIGSLQSVVSPKRLEKLKNIGLVIIDEAHHFNLKNSYGKILKQFPDALVLGVTATPRRLDGKGFDDYFDSLVCGISVRELIDQGYLSQFELYAAKNEMKTEGIKVRHGDFSISELAQQNDVIELAGNLIDTYRTHAYGLKTIVFAINIQHSQAIAAAYNEVGISAAHLDGNSTAEERQLTLQRFADGDIKVLSNCQLFTEGFDLPSLEAVQIARPTQSLSLWLQMVGRVLRPFEGKNKAIILDHTSNHIKHGLPDCPLVWTLDGKPKKKDELANKFDHESRKGVEKQIVESQQQLSEVVESFEQKWLKAFQDLVETQRSRDYKKSWIYHRLKEINPPLEVWRMCAEYLGHKPGWAYYQFKEQ